jgi:hypothetical protein
MGKRVNGRRRHQSFPVNFQATAVNSGFFIFHFLKNIPSFPNQYPGIFPSAQQ